MTFYIKQDEQHHWTHFYFTKYFLPFPSLALDGDISSEVSDELYVPASEPGPIDPDPSSELSADCEWILAAKITQPGDNKIEIGIFRIQTKVKQKSVEAPKRLWDTWIVTIISKEMDIVPQ